MKRCLTSSLYPCKFPFVWDDSDKNEDVHEQCTDYKSDGRKWCATATAGEEVKGNGITWNNWDYCIEGCPGKIHFYF